MSPPIRLRDAQVLLVDDHDDLVENLREILEDEGARVTRAARASEALDQAKHGFDIALVDIGLPDATGLSLLPQLRALDDRVEVLLITGSASIEDAIAAVSQGAYAYVLKPFDPDALLATVDRAVEKVRLQRGAHEFARRARIAEKLAAIGELSGGLAHEIRSPLNGASLQLQLLERRISRVSSDPALLGPIEMVQSELNRLSHLVEDFLSFARPVELDLHRFDLPTLLAQVAELLAPEAATHGIELRAELPGAGLVYEGDRHKLQQVLINVVRNAIEALEHTGGDIVVSLVGPEDGMLALRVTDDGPGIPEDIRSRVFEPFFSTKAMGTGLGMAICHALVQRHGGAIHIRCDGGTEVDILLPAPVAGDAAPDRA
ncbi:Sporulation kinase A [Enhygromyxa salina]|uniref:histidine kinase n=1 Tax=Enhygromyxa salina TaxID=215803 RepID=A0A2S9YBL9_9BACT|nr:response regulator [Enhygromyxa salina]PRQ02500.1 Sporulation kinase A [Enhygromyxa salina]